jgi:hypothetical protein
MVALTTEESLFYWEALIEDLQVRNLTLQAELHPYAWFVEYAQHLLLCLTVIRPASIMTRGHNTHPAAQRMYPGRDGTDRCSGAQLQYFVFDIGCKLEQWWRK